MDNSNNKPRVIVVCGPTGSGKTTIAIELAQAYRGEIISADSMQIYRYMDIGTAKPTLQEQARVFHHMIDIVDPDVPFDAARYAKMVRRIIVDLNRKGIIPFVVGGTGFYIKALLRGLFTAPPSDPAIRKRLQNENTVSGTEPLYQRLLASDPDAAEKIHPNDAFRIIRALEVLETTGKPLSNYHAGHQFFDEPFLVLNIGLKMERAKLYDRINRRVDAMIQTGLLGEVEMLLAKGYSNKLKSMQSIGYRHMTDYVIGNLEWDEVVRTLKRDTRRYAKRQLTWFNKDPHIMWISPDNLAYIRQQIDDFLNE